MKYYSKEVQDYWPLTQWEDGWENQEQIIQVYEYGVG